MSALEPRAAIAVLIITGMVAAAYVLMWRGWRRRARQHPDVPPLPPVPQSEADAGGADAADRTDGAGNTIEAPATYLGTTTSGDWLDRVVAHGLGARSAATVSVAAPGVLLRRRSQPSVFIPAETVHSVHTDRAAAGRAVRRAEYLIITWEHGGRLLDTAVRPRHRADRDRLAAAISELASRETTP